MWVAIERLSWQMKTSVVSIQHNMKRIKARRYQPIPNPIAQSQLAMCSEGWCSDLATLALYWKNKTWYSEAFGEIGCILLYLFFFKISFVRTVPHIRSPAAFQSWVSPYVSCFKDGCCSAPVFQGGCWFKPFWVPKAARRAFSWSPSNQLWAVETVPKTKIKKNKKNQTPSPR